MPPLDDSCDSPRAAELFESELDSARNRASRMFVWIMAAQWAAAVVVALSVTPYTWIGAAARVHQHVWIAVLLGGVLASLPMVLAFRRPNWWVTRHVIAVSQMLFSALFIHLSGGRIETHFHVFGSLAFLAMFHDWRVLTTATAVVALDHMARGIWIPISVFGSAAASPWRWVEHAAWVVFEDAVLVTSCVMGLRQLRTIASRRAALERSRDNVERQVRDRTEELIQVAAALRASESETREAKEYAEAASRTKSEFLANMSHEIRTPMTAIIGYADLIGDPEQTPAQRTECVQVIRRNGAALLNIINDILDISKIEAGKMTVEMIACDTAQVLEEVYSLMQVRVVGKGVALEVEYDRSIPPIMSDPHRLRQVLINLVGNAIKFTEKGSVVIRAAVESEGAPTPGTACRARFEISDTGLGMTPEQIGRLFQAFSQADASTTRRFGGTGLGLMISHRLVEIMGGKITVESVRDRGSVFRVEIATTIAEAIAAPADVSQGAKEKAGSPALSGRVLLAEDGPDNQRLIAFLLRQAGAQVEIAQNGRLAVEAAQRSKMDGFPFDLILMDMQMPELDGYAAAALLRKKGWTRPIIALTAHAMASDRAECLCAGCDDYMTKPVDRAALIARCAEWIAKRRDAARAA